MYRTLNLRDAYSLNVYICEVHVIQTSRTQKPPPSLRSTVVVCLQRDINFNVQNLEQVFPAIMQSLHLTSSTTCYGSLKMLQQTGSNFTSKHILQYCARVVQDRVHVYAGACLNNSRPFLWCMKNMYKVSTHWGEVASWWTYAVSSNTNSLDGCACPVYDCQWEAMQGNQIEDFPHHCKIPGLN